MTYLNQTFPIHYLIQLQENNNKKNLHTISISTSQETEYPENLSNLPKDGLEFTTTSINSKSSSEDTKSKDKEGTTLK